MTGNCFLECQRCDWRSDISVDEDALTLQYEEHLLEDHWLAPIVCREGIDFDENGEEL